MGTRAHLDAATLPLYFEVLLYAVERHQVVHLLQVARALQPLLEVRLQRALQLELQRDTVALRPVTSSGVGHLARAEAEKAPLTVLLICSGGGGRWSTEASVLGAPGPTAGASARP